MEELREKLSAVLSDRLYQVIISNPRKKEGAFKIKIRPVMVKGRICFQETISKGTQVFHENHEKDEMLLKILSYMETDFKQLLSPRRSCGVFGCSSGCPGWGQRRLWPSFPP